MAMELLRGQDLSAVLKQRGALSPSEVLAIFEQLGHGLGAAHRIGIVHRDIKPANLFIADSRL
jgi:serine/threonine-protein kinase